jgi:hypothetical protein
MSDTKSRLESMRLDAKLRKQSGVARPQFRGQCWAEVRVYTGQMFPSFVQCSKKARPGMRTCYWHRDHEADAQMLNEPDKGA